MKATSKNPKLCVTRPLQNAHLPHVNSAFGAITSLDFGVFRGCLKKSATFLAAILYLTGIAAHAQSLGDLAREEKKRREAFSGRITIIENIPSAVPVSAPASAPDMEALTDEEFDRQLAEAANEFNKTLPIMLDSEIRLDTVNVLPNKTWMMAYTFVDYSMTDWRLREEEFKNYIRPKLLNYIKTGSDLESLRNNNAIFVVMVRDEGGIVIFTSSFGDGDYREEDSVDEYEYEYEE